MGQAGVAFTDARGLEGASFPKVMGIEDQQLFPESEMSQYCFEGIIGTSPAIRTCWNKSALWRLRMPPSCFTARRALERS